MLRNVSILQHSARSARSLVLHAVELWGTATDQPMVNWNTQHLPSSEPATAADAAAERFRASVGTRPARRLPEPPAAMAAAGFTAELWDRFTTDRFHHWHSIGGILDPLEWLADQG